MHEGTHDGLRFPKDANDNDYEVPAELGEKLMRRDQELLDAKHRSSRSEQR